MIEIPKFKYLDEEKHIAIIDTSTISFMQTLKRKGIDVEYILNDYDLLLIPKWVLIEINDAPGRIDYVHKLIKQGYPIYYIDEKTYSKLVNNEEGNLYKIVLASTYQLASIRSYLRRVVDKDDPLDTESYKKWINRLYDEWPLSKEMLSSGRIRKKNAGEVSITILAEIISWYYPKTKIITVYTQDSDVYDFQRTAEDYLREIFLLRTPVPISFKTNDATLCQLVRDGYLDIKNLGYYRNNIRYMTYTKEQDDHSIVLVRELVDNYLFKQLVFDRRVHIIF